MRSASRAHHRCPGTTALATDLSALRRVRVAARTALCSLLVAALAAVGLVAANEVPRPPTLLGVATGSYGDASGGASPGNPDFCRDLRMLREATGRAPAFRQVVWPMTTPDDHWQDTPPAQGNAHATQRWRRLSLLESHHRLGTTPYVSFEPDRGMSWYRTREYARFVDGMVATLGEWVARGEGRRILLAPWPEMNLAEHPWSEPVDFSAADYVTAFRDLVTRIRRGGLGSEHVRIVWSVNARPTPGRESYVAYYPGHAWVDVVGIHALDRTGAGWRPTYHQHPDLLAELRRQVRGKPILLAQTASVGPHGRWRLAQDDWLRAMAQEVTHDDQLVGLLYFNRDKAGDADTRAWDSNLEDRVEVGDALAEVVEALAPPSDGAWLFDGRLDDWVRSIGGEPAHPTPSRLLEVEHRALGGCGHDEPAGQVPGPSLLGCPLDTTPEAAAGTADRLVACIESLEPPSA